MKMNCMISGKLSPPQQLILVHHAHVRISTALFDFSEPLLMSFLKLPADLLFLPNGAVHHLDLRAAPYVVRVPCGRGHVPALLC